MIPSPGPTGSGTKRLEDRGPALARVRRFFLARTNELVLVGLAGFLFLVATNTQTGWLYVVVALLLGTLVAGFLGPRATLRGLEVRRRVPGPASRGDEVRVELELHNPSRVDRLLVTVEETLPESLPGEPRTRRILVERIPAGGSARVSYPVACSLRGCHGFPAPALQTGTPLGLFPARREVPAGGGPLVIYPRGPRLARASLLSADPRRVEARRSLARAGAGQDFLGLRPYQAGEDIRFVHWPATARTGDLMVREFQASGGQSLAVLIDVAREGASGSGASSNLEEALSAAASLTDLARRNQVPLTVLAERDGHVQHRRSSGEAALDFLARLTPEGRLPWEDLLLETSRLVPKDSHLFLLALRPVSDPALLAPLAARRVRVTAVFFPGRSPVGGPEAEGFRESLARLRAAGLDARLQQPGRDLASLLQGGGLP